MTPEHLSARLRALLRTVLGDPGLEVSDLVRLSGGASRETWAFRADGDRLILQRQLPGNSDRTMAEEAATLRAAFEAGVPVARLVCGSAEPSDLGAGYLITEHVDGETIARRILRDGSFARAREVLVRDCGRALAAIHAVPASDLPALPRVDQLAEYRRRLDDLAEPHPAFEHAFRWLSEHRPEPVGETLVHGDFRLGNLIVGPTGLDAVIDWELAHLGDPMEDLGWLCTRAWRFGSPEPVAGLGSYDELFEAYAAASGRSVDPAVVRWWEVLGTLKWGIMCIIQARKHLDGLSRSMELAAIGRRVCENEHDLLLLLEPDALAAALARPLPAPVDEPGLHGRPTARELVEATREWVAGDVRQLAAGQLGFQSRVAENVLSILERELTLGPSMAEAHANRLAALGFANDEELAAAVRASNQPQPLVRAIADAVVDKLRVANPRWFAE